MSAFSPSLPAETPAASQPAAAGQRLSIQRLQPLLGEAARYLVASAAALAVDMLTLTLLVERAGWHYLWAATAAYLLGTFVAFFISVRWVFKHRAFTSWLAGLGVFALLGLLGLGVNLLVMWGATEALHTPYLLAKVLAAGTSFIVNFSARRVALFMQRHRHPSHP